MTSMFLSARIGPAASAPGNVSALAKVSVTGFGSDEDEALVWRRRAAALPRPPAVLLSLRQASALLGAVARRDVLLLGVLLRVLLDHRRQELLVGRVVVGDDLPVLAVPLLDAGLVCALVVMAGELDGLQHAFEAERLQAVSREVEVLEAPAHLLAGERLVAELPLCSADRLDAQHGVDETAVVEHLGEVVLGRCLALGEDELLEVLVHLELARRVLEHQRLVADGLVAGRR